MTKWLTSDVTKGAGQAGQTKLSVALTVSPDTAHLSQTVQT